MRKLFIALSIVEALACMQAHAENESAPYIDPRFGRSYTHISDLLNDRPDPSKPLVLKNSLFNTYFEKNSEDIATIYSQRAPSVSVPKHIETIPRSIVDFANFNTTFLLGYLFKGYTSTNKTFDIPFVVTSDKSRKSAGYDEYYKGDSVCAGMTYLEANLKNLCHIDKRLNYGLIEINYSKSIDLFQEKKQIRQIPENGIQESYSYKVFRSFPELIGFHSNVDGNGFCAPLSSFDSKIYSADLDAYVDENTRFNALNTKCYKNSINQCNLYFTGINTSKLFGQQYSLNNPTVFDHFSPESNLQIHFGINERPYLNLKNTILSDSTFINYGFYTEAELSVFQDLGYDISVREFYGNSVYKSGTAKERGNYVFSSGFTSWSKEQNSYVPNQSSSVPLSVGTHIYGSYNDVEQIGTIASSGFGSVGIRIDGSYTNLTIPKKAVIIENGINSSGIAVSYGRDNVINIAGSIAARSKEGIGLRFDFGSNALSDLREYQGSYRRVRTKDVRDGVISKAVGENLKAPNDIKGPLVSELNISGSVEGNKSAIFIDDSAHVKKINFLDKAKIKGNIISKWLAFVGENRNTLYAAHSNTSLLPGKLQFDEKSKPEGGDINRIIQKLGTNINFGVKVRDDFSTVSVLTYVPDKKSNITIDGNIVGSSLLLSSFGGHTHINGYMDVKRLYIGNSVINLTTPSSNTNYVDELVMAKGGQLDLTNGDAEKFVVRNKSVISSNAIFCVDTDVNATIQDKVVFEGKLIAPDGVVNFEPGMSYNDVKKYSSDPKLLMNFMNKFVKNTNRQLSKYQVTTRFPKHLWYVQGDMGRQVKCSSRGCYIGDFVNSYAKSSEPLPTWRYVLSFVGCFILICLAFVFTRKTKANRFG